MDENKSIFQFKSFVLQHGNPGLKITTEACLLGAISAEFPAKRILDIGTGCGLLACMYAQKNPSSKIDGVEIDEEVANLAQKNIHESPFKNQIQIIHQAIEAFPTTASYDLILSNPPFFFDHLKSPDPKRNLAMHSEDLKPQKLIEIMVKQLAPKGKIILLYPEKEMTIFIQLASQNKLYLEEKWEIWTKENGKIIRIIALFGKTEKKVKNHIVAIKGVNNEYSLRFKNYLKDYYLIF